MQWSPVISMKQKMLRFATTDEEFASAEQVDCPQIEVEEGLRWIWRTFMKLNESRSWIGGGMSAPIPSPISFGAVITWAAYHEYDEQSTYILSECIESMDKIFIEHSIEQHQRNQRAKKNA